MTSRFIALPLESGEAFLLQTESQDRTRNILVDSGARNGVSKHGHPLLNAIQKVGSEIAKLDICICTHQDNDHSNGFKDFADTWCSNGNHIGEFWLPGRWAAALPLVLTNPPKFVRKLVEGAYEISSMDAVGDDPWLENPRLRQDIRRAFGEVGIFDDKSVSSPERDFAMSLGVEGKNISDLRANLEESNEVNILSKASMLWARYWGPWTDPYLIYLLLCSIETAQTIQKIAHSALRWKIPIRWFDFGLYEQHKKASGGEPGLLEPINSMELKKPPLDMKPEVLVLCLYLSRQNVESLVFLRPEDEYEPATLFLGDSRLAFGRPRPISSFKINQSPPKRRMIVTAPHHGSEVNDHAYGVIEKWLGNKHPDLITIRNGGQQNQKLKRYLNFQKRACVRCWKCPGRQKPHTVAVGTDGPNWLWPPEQYNPCK